KGFVKRVLDVPDIVLTVESSKLDLGGLLSQSDTDQVKSSERDAPLLDRLRRWAHSSHVDAGLLVSKARYRQMLFRELSAHLRMGEGRIEFHRLSGDTTDGTVTGEASLDFRDPSRIDLTGSFD